MAKRIAVHTLILHRTGKRVRVNPGQVVDLSDAELEDIRRTNPGAVKKIETPVETNEVKLPDAPKPQTGKQGKGKQEEKPAAETPAATAAAAVADDEI
jgi:hypothetical protein